ncbi:MAG TPA: hypothetical protein VFL10_18290 [Ornithinibacter sp.]|nr:hypothetical protein [Ornithinibacter sp.]
MSGLPPLPGHPGAMRLLADRLASTAQRLSALAAVVARLRDGATWDGPAGEAFGARLREVGPVLDAVARRRGGAAAPLRVLAAAMEEAQAVIGASMLDVAEAEHAYAVLEDRAAALVGAGADEGSAELLVVRHLQVEQVEAQRVARARHAAASERFRAADARCATVLRTLSIDDIADPLTYRVLAGVSSAGHDVATLGPVATVVPELKPVVALADGAAVVADAALLVAFDEGDAGRLAVGAGLAATGAFGGVLRLGSTAGAERTAAGVVSTARLTARQRLAVGVVQQARARRDALRASFRVPPARGTPSAVLGGPAPRPSALTGPGPGRGLSVPAVVNRLRIGARQTAVGARAAARQRVDRAFLDDWRLATANGRQAQRMYAAGATLEVASTAAAKSGTGRPEGGGSVR